MLSGRQFREFTNNVRSTGDTVHVGTGERPQTGYMVALPGREVRHPLGKFDLPDVTKYVAHHASELDAPDQYLGGWAQHGQAYLDVSRRYADEDTALVEGWKGNQEAIHRNADHEDIDVPLSPRDLPIWKR